MNVKLWWNRFQYKRDINLKRRQLRKETFDFELIGMIAAVGIWVLTLMAVIVWAHSLISGHLP